jgi:hypothetical protein
MHSQGCLRFISLLLPFFSLPSTKGEKASALADSFVTLAEDRRRFRGCKLTNRFQWQTWGEQELPSPR